MSDRISRRAVLAAIALQTDLPEPQGVEFFKTGQTSDSSRLDINLDSVADLHAWLPYFGMTEKTVHAQPYTHKEEPLRGQTTTLANAYSSDDWCGWRVHLSALDPVGEPTPALDDVTREQLQAVAGEQPAQASGGWEDDLPAYNELAGAEVPA